MLGTPQSQNHILDSPGKRRDLGFFPFRQSYVVRKGYSEEIFEVFMKGDLDQAKGRGKWEIYRVWARTDDGFGNTITLHEAIR